MTALLSLLQQRQADWATLAKSDAGAAGTFARGFAVVSKDVAVYANPTTEAARVEEATMTSWFTISTSSLDREGDSLNPAGCLKTIANYARNPVVSLDHFRQEPLPIGTSVGDKGLPLIIGPDYIKAGCKHHDLTKTARDVWNLVKAGILRGASIAFMPLKAKKVGEISKGSLSSARYVFDGYDVSEWAICSVPVNPEAVRIELSRGHIESDEFKKSLASFAEKPLEYAHGWNPQEITMPAVNIRDIAAVRFSKAHWPEADKVTDWLKSMGFDQSVHVDHPKSFDYVQQQGEHEKSVKLGDGVEGLLLKGKVVVETPTDKTIPVLPDETPPVVQKADDGKKEPKKEGDKPKGPARTTHAVMSLGDLVNHHKGYKEYLTKAMSELDHGPTCELYKKFHDMEDEKDEMIKGHVGQHFDGVDMNRVSADRHAEREEEEQGKKKEADKKKQKALDDAAAEAAVLEKIAASLTEQQKAITDITKSVIEAKEVQTKVKDRLKLVS